MIHSPAAVAGEQRLYSKRLAGRAGAAAVRRSSPPLPDEHPAGEPREGIERDATALTLEVRLSNKGAQEMYKRFGFTAVGVRKGYYADTGEDALVMWAYEVDQRAYGELPNGLERGIRGTTVFEAPKRW